MRLLDPFSGYDKANGIAVFHVALFVGSFSCSFYEKYHVEGDIHNAFIHLRYSHVVVFCLSLISALTSVSSNLKPKEKREDEEVDLADLDKNDEDIEKKKEEMQERNRDSPWKIIATVCTIISIFQYSIVVFFAQLVLT